MDALGAISLATEPPHPTELRQERVRKADKIIVKNMYKHIFGIALY